MHTTGTGPRHRRWVRWVLLGGLVIALAAVGTWRVFGTVDPARMDDSGLAAYLQRELEGRSIPVSGVAVTTWEGEGREAMIRLHTPNVEAINENLPVVMADITTTIRGLVEEQGVALDFYCVELTGDLGEELLFLRVDINNQSSKWRQDPRLSKLWIGPLPKAIQEHMTGGGQ